MSRKHISLRRIFFDSVIYRHKWFGKMIGVKYAEGFISEKMVGLKNFDAIIKENT